MLKLKQKVVVTGSISCGKSSVCQLFKELGASVLNADEIVHQLLSLKTSLGNQVIQLLGPDVVAGDHFDRAKIAKKVFDDPNLLQSLEHLLHPQVQKEIDRQFQEYLLHSQAPLFVVEIPLYFEGSPNPQDIVVVVLTDENLAKDRFKQKTGGDEKEFFKRQKRLIPVKKKASLARYVIENNQGLDELKLHVHQLFNQLKSLAT